MRWPVASQHAEIIEACGVQKNNGAYGEQFHVFCATSFVVPGCSEVMAISCPATKLKKSLFQHGFVQKFQYANGVIWEFAA